MLIYQLEAASKSQAEMLILIERFNPLLKKYGRMLGTEDGYQDMSLAFIEFAKSFRSNTIRDCSDGAVVNYIAKSMKNAYNKLLKMKIRQNFPCISWDELTENENYSLSNGPDDEPISALLSDYHLTKKESEVLWLFFEDGYSASEIARVMHVSRQNINQIKLHAIAKLRGTAG